VSLYFVIKRNDYFPPGVYLKTSGMGMVRELEKDEKGSPKAKEIGLAIPLKDIRGHVIRLQDGGFDDGR